MPIVTRGTIRNIKGRSLANEPKADIQYNAK